jgi:hypothetical protein
MILPIVSWRRAGVPRAARILAAGVATALLASTHLHAASAQSRREVVGVLETRVPSHDEFLLRGTLPLPRGVYPRPDGRNALELLDYDGKPLLTQIEIVSRYPGEADGADVVELLAVAHRDPAAPIGSRAQYAVVRSTRLSPLQPTPGRAVPDAVDEFLVDPGALEIASYDCFGNRYVCRPLMRPQPFQVLHAGPVMAELRVPMQMVPENEQKGSTLPHSFGVHAYLSWYARFRAVGLDLRFHNAHDGHDLDSPLDDPLDKLYFQRLEISMPADWNLQQDFDDPFFGQERLEGGRRIVELVQPNPDGTMHVIRWEGQFHRRLMLSPATPLSMHRARTLLDGEGRAFATRGFAANGREYWSWWNRETARYFPQRFQLPWLEHVGRDVLEGDLASEFEFLRSHLASGQGVDDYPLASGRMGWGHPYGVSYGGMTSGLEINCYDGLVAASAASPLGFRVFSALHRMQTDRQPNALYRLDGEPSSVEEWLVENGDRDYVPFEHFDVPLIYGSRPDPFGVRSAPQFQNDFVAANGLRPAYEAQHFNFDPHDHQHFIRYTRSAKVLAWLANDSLAIDDLLHQTENFHFSYHEHYNGPYNAIQGSGLLQKIRYVDEHAGQGFPFGRGEAWGLDCAAAAYSLADPAWRARKLPWLQRISQVLSRGQAQCSGFIQAFISNKAVDGKYQARQQIEQSITENALVGLHESVYAGAYPDFSAMTLDVLDGSLRAFIGEMAWFPGEFGPWRYTGVGPLDPDLPVWCSKAEMPSDAFTDGDIEAFQDWSSFGYGYELTGDNEFLRKARVQIGGADFQDLVERMHSAGLTNIENRAALLTVVQRLSGGL